MANEIKDKDDIQKCKEEIDAVLAKYDCIYDFALLLRPGRPPDALMKIAKKPNKPMIFGPFGTRGRG